MFPWGLEGFLRVLMYSDGCFLTFIMGQPEPEFRPPMSEVVQALVRLVQRANMSKRTFGSDQGGSQRGGDNPDPEAQEM